MAFVEPFAGVALNANVWDEDHSGAITLAVAGGAVGITAVDVNGDEARIDMQNLVTVRRGYNVDAHVMYENLAFEGAATAPTYYVGIGFRSHVGPDPNRDQFILELETRSVDNGATWLHAKRTSNTGPAGLADDGVPLADPELGGDSGLRLTRNAGTGVWTLYYWDVATLSWVAIAGALGVHTMGAAGTPYVGDGYLYLVHGRRA